MNVFHRFTRASLRQNPSRTLVTVIGIVLSMALVTAVIQGAYSGIQFLVRSEVERVGAFHGFRASMTDEEAGRLKEMDFIEKTGVWHTVGWTKIDSRNGYKPYVVIRGMEPGFTDMVTVHLISGRLPENDSELIVPDYMAEDSGVSWKIGDTLHLAVGKRVAAGSTVELDGAFALEDPDADTPVFQEELTDESERTYTVVGIYQRLSYEVENWATPGYTAVTCWDGQDTGRQSVFFTVKDVKHYYDNVNSPEMSSLQYDSGGDHDDLLRLQGAVRSENLSTFIYGFAGVLIFLIAFGSISLIYNSFAISVSERTRQFGILKSVGATRKQIRGSVLYEALLLGVVGVLGGAVIGCLGIGITLWALWDAFAAFSMGSGVQMKLVISPLGLVIAAAVCLLTTLISAWIPAQRANRVSAIDAIRQTGDVKVRGKDVKVSGLTKKLFGFEGMMAAKNFKRNRRRYRATVVSLFLSVTLFIAASSFCAYLTDAVGTATANDTRADIHYATVGDQRPDPDQVLGIIMDVAGVEEACYADCDDAEIHISADIVNPEWINRYGVPESTDGLSDADVYAHLVFLDETTFGRLCRDNGLDPADYHDAAAPMALFFNRSSGRAYSENGDSKWYDVKVMDESKLPLTVYTAQPRTFDGYTLMEVDDDTYFFYPDEYVQEINGRWRDGEDVGLDRSRAMALTAQEAEERAELILGAVVKDVPILLPNDSPAVIYPYAMREAVLGEGVKEIYQTDFALRAKDHARVFAAVEKELKANGMETGRLFDKAAEKESQRMLVTVVRVFSYGFIILISLIAMANVFNTVSTSVMLRRREFAMLKSIGLGEKGFRKMMNYECVIYGCKGLLWGLPAAVALTYVIYRITGGIVERSFYIPWYSVVIAVGSVFAVVFATMLYSTNVIRRDNPIDALKQENL